MAVKTLTLASVFAHTCSKDRANKSAVILTGCDGNIANVENPLSVYVRRQTKKRHLSVNPNNPTLHTKTGGFTC